MKVGVTKEKILKIISEDLILRVIYEEKGKVVEVEILNASKLHGGFLTEILKAPKREIVEIV